jgi:hypothetical protein
MKLPFKEEIISDSIRDFEQDTDSETIYGIVIEKIE